MRGAEEEEEQQQQQDEQDEQEQEEQEEKVGCRTRNAPVISVCAVSYYRTFCQLMCSYKI